MAQNAYVTIDTTQNSNTDQQYPIVDESQLYRPMARYRGANFFNASLRSNMVGKLIGDNKIKVFNENPFIDRVTVTTTAAASATSLVVPSNSWQMIRNGERMFHIQSNQTVIVNAQPTSGTLSVDALTNQITAGTTLKLQGPTIGENWPRSTPLERGTNYHYDYTSLKQWSWAMTYHMKGRKMYLEPEQSRLEKQFDDRVQMFINNELLFSKAVEGTSSNNNTSSTNGLVPQGLQYNWIPTPGAITQDLLNQGAETLRTWGNAEGMLELIMAPSLRAKWSTWPYSTNYGIARSQVEVGTFGSGPLKKVASAIDGIDGWIPTVDQSLETPGYNNMLIGVFWGGVKPIKFLDDYMQPQCQDPGTGAIMYQLTRSCGLEFPISAGAVVVFTNVNQFLV